MIIQGSLDSGAFDVFVLSDGMIGDSLTDRFGDDLNKSFGSLPRSTGKGADPWANPTQPADAGCSAQAEPAGLLYRVFKIRNKK